MGRISKSSFQRSLLSAALSKTGAASLPLRLSEPWRDADVGFSSLTVLVARTLPFSSAMVAVQGQADEKHWSGQWGAGGMGAEYGRGANEPP